MEGLQCVVTLFALSFSPHVQRNSRPHLLLGAHIVETLLPLSIAPIAPFHRIRGRGQQFVIETCQGFLPCRRKKLLERLTQMLEPVQAMPQLRQLVERGLRPTPSIEQGVDLLHDLADLPQLRQPPRDAPQRLAVALAQVMFDEQVPMREQFGALVCQAVFLAGSLLCRLCARTPPGQFGLLGRQALALTRHGTQHRLDDVLDDMKLADLMWHPTKDLGEGLGIERRAIGRDTQQRQVTCHQGRFQPPKKRPDIIVVGIVVSDCREDALVAAIIDSGEHTKGAVISFIGGHITRKISERPVEEVRPHTRLRLFSPQPRPSSGWW